MLFPGVDFVYELHIFVFLGDAAKAISRVLITGGDMFFVFFLSFFRRFLFENLTEDNILAIKSKIIRFGGNPTAAKRRGWMTT